MLGALGLGSTVQAAGCSDDAPATGGDAGLGGDAGGDAGLGSDAGDAAMASDVPPEPTTLFRHGVASGDPTPEAVIVWTRVTALAGARLDPTVEVRYEVARDTAFTMMVTSGAFNTTAERDYTVKVDLTGLSPATTYYYRFRALGMVSPVGRTRTAPRGEVAQVRLGVVSCSSMGHGYFHVYRSLARRLDLDAIVHLGDYIYEYGTRQYGGVREYDPPTEITTLSDYRRRYAHYRRDPDLQALHQQTPFIVTWDDHESADNSYSEGAENHTPSTEGAWSARKAAAIQAHREWMPIREHETPGRIWRKLAYGDLVDLILLDTRLWGRPLQVNNADAGLTDPARQLLGADQEQWFFQEVSTSRARWKVVAQQVMMGQLVQLLNSDQWDGYPAARQRFFSLLRAMMVQNVVVLTGDIHTSWAIELTETPQDSMSYDPATGRGALAVEFVYPGVTSPGFPQVIANTVLPQVMRESRHVKFVDLVRRGYGILDITPTRLQSALYLHVDGETARPSPTDAAFATAWSVAHNSAHLVQDQAAAPAPSAVPPAAPTP